LLPSAYLPLEVLWRGSPRPAAQDVLSIRANLFFHNRRPPERESIRVWSLQSPNDAEITRSLRSVHIYDFPSTGIQVLINGQVKGTDVVNDASSVPGHQSVTRDHLLAWLL
jgi:hypothetical protein